MRAVDRRAFAWCLLVALSTGATVIRAQSPSASAKPIRLTLGKPELVTTAEFNFALSAVRFANGNILVADFDDRDLKMIDGRTGAVRVVGRVGSGPGEYRHPSRVIAWAGNTAVVFDPQLSRATQYDANGVAVRSTTMPVRSGLPDAGASVGRAGRVYFVESPFDSERGMPAPTQNVERWVWGARSATPVMTIQGAPYLQVKSAPATGPEGRGMELTIQTVPHASVDAFAALSDRWQVVARGAARVLEWRDSTGRIRETVTFPGTPVAITDSAKALTVPSALRAQIGRWYPPFSNTPPVVSSNDRVWLRSLPERADSADWIGFRRGGAAPQLIRLKRSAILLGVSEPYAFVLQFGDDDLQRLELYRLREGRQTPR